MTDLLDERPKATHQARLGRTETWSTPDLALTPIPQAPALAILVNEAAGGYRWFGLARLKWGLRAAGLEDRVPLILCAGHELQAKAVALVRAGVRVVGVFGGDGSARSVALALRGLDVPVFPLPGGTLNRLCHRVHGHANLGQTLRDFAKARPKWLSGCLANEHVFLVASGFGPWMTFQDMREAIRSRGVLQGLRLIKSLRQDLFSGRLSTLGTGRTHDVVIAAPGLVDAAFGLGSQAMHGRKVGLEIAEARLHGIARLVWLAAHVLARNWRKLPYVQASDAAEHILESDGEEIHGLVDGERQSFGRSVCLKAIPRAALILSTRSDLEC